MNHKKFALLAALCLSLCISTPAQNIEKLSDQQIHHLALLGQVWGFLKYYHPVVAKGKFDWDKELFRKIHTVKRARDGNEFSSVLVSWIDSLGAVP
jgi:carboxyl-terminal processing protease